MADPSADQAIAEAIANTKQERLEATQPQVSRTARRAQALRPQDPLPTRPSTPLVPNPEPVQQEPTRPNQVQEPAEKPVQSEQPAQAVPQLQQQAAPPPEPQSLAEGSTRPYLYFLEAQTSLFNQNWERATALATTGILSLMIGAATQIADKAAEAAAKLEAEAGKTESNGRPLS
jgi:hypothetical protein